MANILKQFQRLLPHSPLLVGNVVVVQGSELRIELDDGTRHNARGAAEVGARVYFRPGGTVEGEAPDMTVGEIII